MHCVLRRSMDLKCREKKMRLFMHEACISYTKEGKERNGGTGHAPTSSDPHHQNRHGASRSRSLVSPVAETPNKAGYSRARAATQLFCPQARHCSVPAIYGLLLSIIAVAPLHNIYLPSRSDCRCRVRSFLPSIPQCSATPPPSPPQQTSFIYCGQSTRVRYGVLQQLQGGIERTDH
jgi:hypothetical protein